jgi:hypothetical protein
MLTDAKERRDDSRKKRWRKYKRKRMRERTDQVSKE